MYTNLSKLPNVRFLDITQKRGKLVEAVSIFRSPLGERLGEGQVYRGINPPVAPACKGGFLNLLLASSAELGRLPTRQAEVIPRPRTLLRPAADALGAVAVRALHSQGKGYFNKLLLAKGRYSGSPTSVIIQLLKGFVW